MKTKDELQAIIDELGAVCDRHGIVLVGTEGGMCYAEIGILDDEEIDKHYPDLSFHFDTNVQTSYCGGPMVPCIGRLRAPKGERKREDPHQV
jgi:hypothetical protein